MRRLLLSLAVAGVLSVTALLGAPAFAHGGLVDGSPGPGDEVPTDTRVLRLEFLDLVADAPAYVAVLGTDAEPLAVGTTTILGTTTVCARTDGLAPGVYTLQYDVLDAEEGRLTGNYQFAVTADAPAADAGACARVDLAEPGEAQSLLEMATPDETSPWLGRGLAALGVAVVAAVVVRLRRQRAAAAAKQHRPSDPTDPTEPAAD